MRVGRIRYGRFQHLAWTICEGFALTVSVTETRIDPHGVAIFHGDRPISSATDDFLGFAAIADRFVGALSSQAESGGIVLGIEGAWGSGKSSLMNLILEKIRCQAASSIEVLEFRPWLVGDRDQLLGSYFEDLAKSIAVVEAEAGDATRTTTLKAKSVAEQVRGYAKHLGAAGKLASFAGLVVPGAGVAGEAIQKFIDALATETEGPTLAGQKDKLGNALAGLNKRILVAIDDVDRLDPAEVAELLRLVRSVADFPNVVYLLCYDGEALAAAVKTATKVESGRAYLEKIIQTEISVPRPEWYALRRLFSRELVKFAAAPESVSFRLTRAIDVAGARAFDTPRTVVRVLDSLRLIWPSLKGSVDLADLVWLRILAVSAPSLYRWVEEYLDDLAAIATGKAMMGANDRVKAGERLDKALASDSLNWDEIKYEFLEILPGIGHGARDDKGGDGRVYEREYGRDQDSAEHRRLKSPDHSRLYFALARAPGSVDRQDIDNLLRAASESTAAAVEAFSALLDELNVSGITKAERMLDQLGNCTLEQLLRTDCAALALAIIAVAEKLAHQQGDEFGRPPGWSAATNALRAMRQVLSPGEWSRVIRVIAFESRNLMFLTHLIRHDTFNLGFYGDKIDKEDAVTTRAQFKILREAVFNQYRELGLEGVLRSERPSSILFAWAQGGGRQEVVERVAKYVRGRRPALLRFLLAVIGVDRPGVTSSLTPEAIKLFFNDEGAVIREVAALARVGNRKAKSILSTVEYSLRFENKSIEDWLTLPEPEPETDDGASSLQPTSGPRQKSGVTRSRTASAKKEAT